MFRVLMAAFSTLAALGSLPGIAAPLLPDPTAADC